MPRRARTRRARKNEARSQAEREAACAELEAELHREWREQSVTDEATETMGVEGIEPRGDGLDQPGSNM